MRRSMNLTGLRNGGIPMLRGKSPAVPAKMVEEINSTPKCHDCMTCDDSKTCAMLRFNQMMSYKILVPRTMMHS